MRFHAVGALLIWMLLLHSAGAALITYFAPFHENLTAYDGVNLVSIDTYIFALDNSESNPVTAIELELRGKFYTVPGINSLFRRTPYFPLILSTPVADSWFVTDGTQVVGESIDNTTTLYASWSYPGEVTPIVPANSTSPLAFLSVPTGTEVTFYGGRAKIDGQFIDLPPDNLAVPEPTTVVLLSLTLLGLAGHTRRW
ncbi:PEP-CTERM sorting domain-containing protein [Aeoliella sp.]|uniref:PEP-CTERM sorting domain-containing protein n=1 Tax=Aeoliella sp. TaxID=2795800 RepID=UPI003CCB96DB